MNNIKRAMRIFNESVEDKDLEELEEAKDYKVGKLNVSIYDNGGETMDRYTIVPKGEEFKERNGMNQMIGSSNDPQGFWQHTSGKIGSHLGKKIDFDKLPEAVQKAIKNEFGEQTEMKMEEKKEEVKEESKETLKEGHAETSELKIYIDNEQSLDKQKMEIYKNLSRKQKKGIYEHDLAVKLFMYLVENGAKKYAKESGDDVVWHEMFSKADRKQVAEELTKDFEDAYKNKEYDFMKECSEEKEMNEGIGYELYAKGADRIQSQTVQVNQFAKKLADLVRENAPLSKKKKAIKDLKSWVSTINKELDMLDSDVDNLEGYKKEPLKEDVVSESASDEKKAINMAFKGYDKLSKEQQEEFIKEIMETAKKLKVTATIEDIGEGGKVVNTKIVKEEVVQEASGNKTVKEPMFEVGDMVFSWQNPDEARPVTKINKSDDPQYDHQYIVSLKDKDGYTRSSKWMGEKSLSKSKVN